MPLSPGSHFADGRFLIHTLLAAGAACDTYLVTDRASGGRAALRVREFTDAAKTTRVALLHDRFRREIEVRDRMKFAPRTYVLTVHEMLELPTALALLVEFAEHGSLADRLRSGPSTIPLAIHWLRNAASGLQALHNQGITHGDLTPAHIFLTGSGDAKIGGLGLAQTPSSLVQPLMQGRSPSAYASPEHALPQPLSPTSDVYSLGCIAFELLTGRTWAVAKLSVAAPSQLRTEIPNWLDEAVMRMLSPLPGQHRDDALDARRRFVDMLGVLKALQQAETTITSALDRPAPAKKARSTVMTHDQQWLQTRVEGLERKVEEQQRTNVYLTTQNQFLKDKVLPRRTFIASGVGVLLGLVARSIGDLLPPILFLPPQTIVIQNYSTVNATNEGIELAPGVQLDLASVPAGRYTIGSDMTKDALTRKDEEPQHIIEHAAFWIGRTEVTVAQFAAFVQAEGYRTTAEIDGVSRAWVDGTAVDVRGADWAHPYGPDSNVELLAHHPVTHVSWIDATRFCAWLAQRTGWDCALPSEAEWEAAARGADGRIYAWGNEAPETYRANFGGGQRSTTPGGWYSTQFAAPSGALDMAGNVWEWTSSRYREYPYRADDGRENPQGADPRVLRGGAFDSPAQQMRAAWRSADEPGAHTYHYGFRVRVRK